MAEQNQNKTKVNTFNKGLHTDYTPAHQPEGTNRFTLNGVSESIDGDMGSIINEPGNIECLDFPLGYILIGSVPVTKDQIVLILNDGTYTIIALKNKNCSYEELVRTSCFGYDIHSQVSGIYKSRNCGRSVYLVDKKDNPVYTFVIEELQNEPDLYKTNGDWDCTKFKLFRNYNHSCITFEGISSGGSIPIGTIQFAVQYLDEDNNPTDWFGLTHPLPIIDENYGIDYDDLDGGDSTQIPPANKSINLSISNLDTRFNSVRLAVIQTTEGTGNTSSAFIVDELSILNKSSISYTYSGIDEDIAQPIDVGEITTNTIKYNSADHINQIHNRLILSNLKQDYIDYSEFQKEALNIQVEYFTKSFFAEDGRGIKSNFSPVAPGGYLTRGYMRDEVYALGIVWILNDGTETPVFHIPGRTKNNTHDGSSISSSLVNSRPINNNHNRVPAPANDWDVTFGSQIPAEEYEHLDSNLSNLERWQVYNTAIRTDKSSNQVSDQYYTKGELSYWESEERYPLSKDCNGNYIFPTETINGKTVGQPIRHHKMPDTTLEPHFYHPNDPENPLNAYVYTINPLGLIVDNIQPPAKYKDKIQGYKIVRSKRTNSNSSVIDKGMMMPNMYQAFNSDNANPAVIYRQTAPYYWDIEDNISNQGPTNVSLNNRPVEIPNEVLDENLCGGGTREDQGYTNKSRTTYPGGPNSGINTEPLFSLHTPRTKFNNANLGESYLKIERELYGSCFKLNSGVWWDDPNEATRILGFYGYTEIPPDENTNRAVNSSAYIDPNSVLTGIFQHNFANNSQQETYVVKTDSGYDHPQPSNASNILNFDDPIKTMDFSGVESGAYRMDSYYTSIKKIDPSQYNSLEDVEYVPAITCVQDKNNTKVQEVWGGDTFISKLYMKKTIEFTDNCDDDSKHVRGVFDTWCESTINSELRHEGSLSDIQQQYYPKSLTADEELKGDPDSDNGWDKFNYYDYNIDYSKENDTKIYFPLQDNFNYCEDCVNEFPTRQAYSEKSFAEERADNYRIFKANNYRDLPAETGEITDVFIKDYNLYTRTEFSLWHNPTNPQKMSTSKANVFIDTGEFFNLRPKELVTTETGYAGGYGKEARVTTQYGTFFVNSEQGRIFLLSDSLNEINKKGMEKWFDKELPIKLNKQFQDSFGIDYPYLNNPAHPIGVGVLAEYDKLFNRYILTKRDFKVVEDYFYSDSIVDSSNFNNIIPQLNSPSIFVFKDDDGVYTFRLKSGPSNFITIQEPTFYPKYFEDHSFTISYSIDLQAWRSWHSYMPRFYTSSTNQLLSAMNTGLFSDNSLWLHNEGQYQNFYNVFYDHIIEFTVNDPFQVNTFDSIHYVSNAFKYDPTHEEYLRKSNLTFDKLWIYNTVQSTNILDLIPKKNNDPFASILQSLQIDEVLVDKNEELWSVNNFRDVVINYETDPIITRSWNDSNIRNNYYIDKYPLQSNHFILDDPFNKEKIRDRFANFRFFFRPTDETDSNGKSLENVKLVTEGFASSIDPSYR